MTELGVAYLSIAASTKGLAPEIKRSLGESESLAAASGKKSGGLFSTGFKGAMGVLGGLVVVGKAAQFLADANAEARESQKVNAITENAIRATGGAAQVTAKQVGDLAASISNKTGIDDEAIQSSANLLLTFKNVHNEAGKGNAIFNRATAAAQDLAASGFGSADGAAKMLGKALNDPAKGMTALSRAGVTFTEEQKNQVKAMIASGNVLGAQRMIMGEVESQVGGAAEASATAAEKLSVKWGNLKETIGTEFVLPAVDKIAGFLSPVIDTISDAIPKVSEFFKSFNDVGGGGAVSGLMTLFSPFSLMLKAIQPLLPQIGAAFTQVGGQLASALLPALGQLSPIIQQVVDALSGSMATVFAALLPVMTQIAGAVLPVLGEVIAAIVPVVLQLVQAFLPLLPVLANLISSLLPPLADMITSLLPAIMPLVGAILDIVQALLPIVGIVIQLVKQLLPPLTEVIMALIPPIAQVVAQIAEALVPVFKSVSQMITTLMPTISMLVDVIGTIIGAVAPVVSVIAGGLIRVLAAVIGIAIKVAGAIVGFVAKGISAIAGFATGVAEKIGQVINWFAGLKDKILGAVGNVGSLLRKAGSSIISGFLSGLKSMWSKVTGWVSGIADWIAQHKGPLTYDRKLLVPAGIAIMTGLHRGLVSSMPMIRSAVDDINAQVASAGGLTGVRIAASSSRMSAFDTTGGAPIQITNYYPQAEPASITTNRALQTAAAIGRL